MCFWNESTVRAMKLASAPMATPMGLAGFSMEPSGLDLVRLPISEVGEY